MNHVHLSSNYNVGPVSDIAERRKRLALLLVLAAVLQLPALFFGMDFCDSGFYATFYDNIFAHPESVSYNFMYYLSGVAGGIISGLTGGSLLALRIAGLLCGLICVACAEVLGHRLPASALAAGVISVCIGIWQTPLSLYNDNMTVALATISLTLLSLATAATNGRGAMIMVVTAGAIAGINTLTRIPNVLEIMFVLILPIAGIRGDRLLRLMTGWTLGWIGGLGVGIGLAAMLGHLQYLWASIGDLAGMGGSEAGESSHGIRALIMAQINAWWGIIKFMVKVSCTAGIAWYITRRMESKWLKAVILTLFGLPCLYWLYSAEIVTALAALSLFGCLASLVSSQKELKLLGLSGLFLMIIVPLGSDYGIYNAGAIILWLSAPAGFCVIKKNCGTIWTWLTCAAISAGGITTAVNGGFYFDDTELSRMTSGIPGTGASALRTSPERADRLAIMLRQLGTHLNPGDTLLVYGSAPMINHLSGTIPAIGCSWPELLSTQMLDSRLRKSPPPQNIMMMRSNTLGSKWGEPSETYRKGLENANVFHSREKTELMDNFITTHPYRLVLERPDFELYSLNFANGVTPETKDTAP